MFPTMATRRLACMLPRLRAASQASFHTSRPAWVNVGDQVPDLTVLVENSPGNKVNLSQELDNGLIIGVPAAFSMSEFSHSLFLRFPFRCPLPPPQKFMHCTSSIHMAWNATPLTNHVFVSPKLNSSPPSLPPSRLSTSSLCSWFKSTVLDTTGPDAVDSLCLIACFACCHCCDCCNSIAF